MSSDSAAVLVLSTATLKPLITAVVEETLARMERERAARGDKLAYPEVEATHLLSLEHHQLRDERRRGRIAASQIVGRRVRYTREDLMAYLRGRRVEAAG
jgi:hypothetical protein